MKKINILYIVLELFAGGLENGIVNLINNSSDEFNHIICCLRQKGVFANRLKKAVKTYQLNMKYGNDYSLPCKIYKIIKDEKVDIVRAFNEEPFFYSILPARFARTPIIYYNGGRTFPEKKRRLIMEKVFGNRASRVVVPSKELKDYLASNVGIRNDLISVIHNGVDLNRFKNEINVVEKKRELRIPERDLVIGTVGRLVRQKDIPTFLMIAKRLLSDQNDITFLIAGDGDLKSDLTRLTKEYAIENKVKFLGIRDDIEEIYSVMDIFLMTARWEGMSNVLLEAMSSRKPILTTNVEGVNEIISDGEQGFILNAGDVDGFVQKILHLDYSKRIEMGEKAFKKVSKSFSIRNMVREYENLYYEIKGVYPKTTINLRLMY